MVSKLGSVSSVVLDDGKEADARLELLAASRQEPSTTNWGLPMTMYHFAVPVYHRQNIHVCMYLKPLHYQSKQRYPVAAYPQLFSTIHLEVGNHCLFSVHSHTSPI